MADLLPPASQTVGNNRTLRHSFRLLGNKEFELSNHLGNVMVTLKDERLVSNTTNLALDLRQQNKEYIALPQSYVNQKLNNVSIVAWVRTSENSGAFDQNWAVLDFDQSDYYSLYVRPDNGKVGFSYFASKSNQVINLAGNAMVNDGQWHHIAVVYSTVQSPSSTTVKIYVDGQLDAQHNFTPYNPIGRNLSTRFGFIGDGSEATFFNGARNKKYYHGQLDEIAYWHRALNQAEIQAAYANNIASILTSNLQAYYSFDEPGGSEIIDQSTNGWSGTAYVNQAQQTSTSPSGTPFTPQTDNRIAASTAMASVASYSDYYPGGSLLPGRHANPGDYRYGFNGKELDDDGTGMAGGGSSYDYGFRIYNPAIAKFLSVDPLSSSYPWYTPYQFAGNKPIWAIDLDGLEEYLVNVYTYKGYPYLILVTDVEVEDRAIDAANTYVVKVHNDKTYHQNSSNQQNKHVDATGNPAHNPQWTAAEVKQIGNEPASLVEEAISYHSEHRTPGEPTKNRVETENRITFDTESAVVNLDPATQEFIEKVAVILMKDEKMMAKIDGYASVSPGINNQQLSQDRADAVKNAIVNQVQVFAKQEGNKIPMASIKNRIVSVGKGEKQDDKTSNNSNQDKVAEVRIVQIPNQ